jgi:two-component system, NarL family, nitrate/nitrite response regulator NarL
LRVEAGNHVQSGKTIALINHQPILLDGLVRLFSGNNAFRLVAFGLPSMATVEAVIASTPALVVLDGGDRERGLAAVQAIAAGSPGTRIVVFTASESIEEAVRALDAGASGYVSSASTGDELIAAVDAVLGGDTFISQQIASKVISALRTVALRKAERQAQMLNVREEQIARLLLKGKTNKEIAKALALSEKTVKHYMSLLMQKLAARNRLELALAIRRSEPMQGPHRVN